MEGVKMVLGKRGEMSKINALKGKKSRRRRKIK